MRSNRCSSDLGLVYRSAGHFRRYALSVYACRRFAHWPCSCYANHALDQTGDAKANALELDGWPYPRHLAGRACGVLIHGDVAGVESVRRALCDWLAWMGLIDAGFNTRIDRMLGYYERYATSHEALDRDIGLQEEVRNVARAIVDAVGALRSGRLRQPGPNCERHVRSSPSP